MGEILKWVVRHLPAWLIALGVVLVVSLIIFGGYVIEWSDGGFWFGPPRPRVEARQSPIAIHDGGSQARDGVTGHLTVGQTMIQWGVANSVPKTYKRQSFSPSFTAPPTVVCSADGAYQNDVSCNLNNVHAAAFEFSIFSPSVGHVGPRAAQWIAVGLKQ